MKYVILMVVLLIFMSLLGMSSMPKYTWFWHAPTSTIAGTPLSISDIHAFVMYDGEGNRNPIFIPSHYNNYTSSFRCVKMSTIANTCDGLCEGPKSNLVCK